MKINISFSRRKLLQWKEKLESLPLEKFVIPLALIFAIIATYLAFVNDRIITYGDAESHLNIAKRIIHSITAGFAQMGGIWLPIPHLMMVPFVYFDSLWRSGLAGSIVSGFSYIVSGLFVYKTFYYLTKDKLSSFIAFMVFALNLNVLYMQATPMTELPLIMFFTISSYFFIKFIKNPSDSISLIVAGLFAFLSSLSRYDGWFLVIFEAMIIVLVRFPIKETWQALKKKDRHWLFTHFQTAEGQVIMFSSLAFLGILLWLIWGYLILGDPFFFTNSSFSAKSQQQSWLARGELPAYKHLFTALGYYAVTVMSNAGILPFLIGIIGFISYIFNKADKHRFYLIMMFSVPFVFNVYTMFVGQSVIFIPHITPTTFEWTLFNVRYGIMMIPTVAFFVGYFFMRSKTTGRLVIVSLLLFQLFLYGIGYSRIITLADGSVGLSRAKRPDAEFWIKDHYDYGIILLDDYARTVSIVRSGFKMQDVIYIGNKPYWEESLVAPEKYARWIVMQKNDTVWRNLLDNPKTQGRLYKYFEKAYTSPEILIFKRKPNVK